MSALRFAAFLFCFVSLLPGQNAPDAKALAEAAEGLPGGEEKMTFVRMCANCHAIGRVTRVKFSKRFWTTVVDDMVSRGAEGTEEEAAAVISYLARHFGKAVNVNTSTAKQLEEGLSFKAAEAEALVRYRTEQGPVKDYEALRKVPGLNAKLLEEQEKNLLF